MHFFTNFLAFEAPWERIVPTKDKLMIYFGVLVVLNIATTCSRDVVVQFVASYLLFFAMNKYSHIA